MSTFLHELNSRVLVCDGAMGTMLQQSGLPSGHCPEEWNVSNPDKVSKIHKAYYEAGADIVETNSFGGNRFRLDFHGHGDDVYKFNKTAAELARSVCPPEKFVAGSVGPSGEFIEPVGTRTVSEMIEIFEEQIRALVDGGIDLIIVETMADFQEIGAAIQAAKTVNSEIPIIASMTFEKSAAGIHTMMGIKPQMMVRQLQPLGVNAIGANCGFGMEEMMNVISEIRQNSDFPILSQANAGSPVWDGSKNVYSESPEERAKAVSKLLEFKPNIIGGCCGTTPAHIAAIREVVDEYNSSQLAIRN
jgi:5-methyltetrahydrofolate--homocysteine methyltransferase